MIKHFAISILLTLGMFGSAAADQGGFASIFNGKDLTGWKSNEETPGCFTVEDGAIKVQGGRAHLFYMGTGGKVDFGDFELKLKIKTMPGANGGVYFHTQFEKSGWPSQGFESQVNATHKDPRKTGSLYGVVDVLVLKSGQESPKGSLLYHTREQAPHSDTEWFDYHIRVQGRNITLKVNGETTVEWVEPEGFDPAKVLLNMPGRKLSRGTFAIQGHDPESTVYYKDIQLKLPN
jgi:hypothetical protein